MKIVPRLGVRRAPRRVAHLIDHREEQQPGGGGKVLAAHQAPAQQAREVAQVALDRQVNQRQTLDHGPVLAGVGPLRHDPLPHPLLINLIGEDAVLRTRPQRIGEHEVAGVAQGVALFLNRHHEPRFRRLAGEVAHALEGATGIVRKLVRVLLGRRRFLDRLVLGQGHRGEEARGVAHVARRAGLVPLAVEARERPIDQDGAARRGGVAHHRDQVVGAAVQQRREAMAGSHLLDERRDGDALEQVFEARGDQVRLKPTARRGGFVYHFPPKEVAEHLQVGTEERLQQDVGVGVVGLVVAPDVRRTAALPELADDRDVVGAEHGRHCGDDPELLRVAEPPAQLAGRARRGASLQTEAFALKRGRRQGEVEPPAGVQVEYVYRVAFKRSIASQVVGSTGGVAVPVGRRPLDAGLAGELGEQIAGAARPVRVTGSAGAGENN